MTVSMAFMLLGLSLVLKVAVSSWLMDNLLGDVVCLTVP